MRLRSRDRALDQVARLLPAGETALAAEICQVKKVRSRARATGAAAGGLARDIAVTSITTAAGFGMSGGGIAAVWLVVTDARLLVFEKTMRITDKKKVELSAPLRAVDVTALRGRVLRSVRVTDRATGDLLVAFNFGWRAGAQRRVVEAVSAPRR